MSYALVYHWWNDGGVDPWRDMANPVVPAIATVRAGNLRLPIHVLDASDDPKPWGRYPLRLDFDVVRVPPSLRAGFPGANPWLIKLLSRSFDVRKFAATLPERNVLFADSDVFWLRDPMPQPESPVGVHGLSTNNGVLAYNSDCPAAAQAFSRWREYTVGCLSDPHFRSEVVSHYYGGAFQDEAVYVYTRQYHPTLFRDIPLRDNFCDFGDRDYAKILENSKNYHFCGSRFGKNRGIFALAVAEFYRRLADVLAPEEVTKIYGEANMYYASEFPFSQLNRARLRFKERVKLHL